MSHAAAPNLARRSARASQRVVHVVVVGLSAVLSIGLIGAVHAKTEPRPAAAKPVAAARRAVVMPALLVTRAEAVIRAESAVPAAATERANAAEPVDLLHDENETPALPSPSQPTLKIRRMLVTAYCPCRKCCGPNAQGLTASGKPVSHNGGRFVAADTSVLGFGTKLVIPGYADGAPVEVIDRGGAIKGDRLDVYFPTHAEALQWGRRWVDVVVVD